MKDVHLLTREQLRLLGQPVRQRVLELLCRETLSTAQIAKRMTGAPSNLYYHVNRLRSSGLIRVMRRKRVRGAVETFYRAVARSFTVPPALLRTGGDPADAAIVPAVEAIAQTVLARCADSVRRGLIGPGPGQDTPMINSVIVRTTPERLHVLRERLLRCIIDFRDESPPRDHDIVEYALLDMLFPLELADGLSTASETQPIRRRGPGVMGRTPS